MFLNFNSSFTMSVHTHYSNFWANHCFFLFQIFKHLTSLEVEDFKDVKSGYSISFVSLSYFLWLLFFKSLWGFNILWHVSSVWYTKWPYRCFHNATELWPKSLFWGYKDYKEFYLPWWRDKNYCYINKVERGNGMGILSPAWCLSTLFFSLAL